MSLIDRIQKGDAWILDNIFQPVADRLPERPSAIDIGMSLQLGAVLFYAVAVILMIVIGHLPFSDAVFNILVWFVGLAFFLGILRIRPLVRAGQANPLRVILAGLRPLSLVFVAIAAWQGANAPRDFLLPFWFMTLSDIVFVLGLYLISCQPRPPYQVRQNKKKTAPFSVIASGLNAR